MYIRRVRKTDKSTGKSYFYYQLIEAYRSAKGPRQRILLNLGKLELDDRERKLLANRIEQLITGQASLIEPLFELGFSQREIIRAKVLIIGKLLNPGSELDIYNWFQQISGLYELMGIKETDISLWTLYRISDKLNSHKDEIEKALVERTRELFGLGEKLILYDLTNTYFEGSLRGSNLARHGNSKERRYDRPLISVALVLDEDGFPKTSRIFPGNVGEPSTLSKILNDLLLNPPRQLKLGKQVPTVVIDAGIATEENLALIRDKGLNYICVDRGRVKGVPEGEVEVICQRDGVIVKAVRERFKGRFEEELSKLQASLGKKGGVKRYEKVIERIGRLKERYSRVAHFYEISVKEENGRAVEISWKIKDPEQMEVGFSGVYCLRTSRKDLSDKDLWSIYNMLSMVEASFRSLKSELSIRPIYHRIDKRIKGHIFTTLLAYHLLCVIQKTLHRQGIHHLWDTIRKFMRSHVRITTTMTSKNNKTIYLRIASQPEEFHMQIYNVLEISLRSLQRTKKIR